MVSLCVASISLRTKEQAMFTPPFCPYKQCERHLEQEDESWWKPCGFHQTKAFGPVQRFRCLSCGRTFSVQTFSVHYYAKRKLCLKRLERLAASSMSIRALGREFQASCGTITNRIDRLTRQGIAIHSSLRPEAIRDESVCFDGLVSFERSKYFPADIGISITCCSRYVLGISHAITKRSGRLRPSQKDRRDLLYEGATFEKAAVVRSMREQLDLIASVRVLTRRRPLLIITDEKKEYGRAFTHHSLYLEQTEDKRSLHILIPSTLARTFCNPLFASNYYDREVRKDQAQHRRATTCYARNAANDMSRMYSYLVWHNYDKRYLIKWPVDRFETHAEIAGIACERIKQLRTKMFEDRFFLSHLSLLPIDEKVWRKNIHEPIPFVPHRPTLPKFAVA